MGVHALTPLAPAAPMPGEDGAAYSSPFASAIAAKRREMERRGLMEALPAVMVVELPPGEIKGISIQDDTWGWTPLDEVEPWWQGSTMIVKGHPDGTTILPAHNTPGWGESIGIRPSKDWEGRIHLYDLTILASGENCASIGQYGTQEKIPLLDVRFVNCVFLDHPDPSIRVVRPISANQTALTFVNCLWYLPNSMEHAVYSRNPIDLGGMFACTVAAVGGQVWQEVNRPEEGPYYPGGKTLLISNLFHNYHLDPSRAGSALTIAGSGRDWLVVDNVVLDVELPPGEQSYGGFTSWDGGQYYTLQGKAILPGVQPQPGEVSNGNIRVEDNLFVQKDGDRQVFKIDSALSAVVRGNGFFGTHQCEMLTHWNKNAGKPTDGGVGSCVWKKNNTPQIVQYALGLGLGGHLLVEPDLHYKNVPIGDVSDTLVF